MTALQYRTIKRVAKGGSGVVYRGELHDGRPVAIKRLSAKNRDDELRSEASLLASFEHPNIVTFFGFQPYSKKKLDLIMEWVGPQLETLCATGAVPIDVSRRIILGVLCGLGYLHSRDRKKLHRDLSPRNILLGEDGSVKLADFGLAKSERAPRTTTVLRGSPPYMSPEQIEGGTLDARSDLFAVGVLFYELLTGAPPFSSSSAIKNRALITPVCTLRPGVPREIGRIVARLLEYERDKRYSSADEVAAELSRAPLQSEAGSADVDLALLMRERGLLGANQTWKRRWCRSGLTASAGLAAGLVLGALGMSHYQQQSLALSATTPEAPGLSVTVPATDALCVAADEEMGGAFTPSTVVATTEKITPRARKSQPAKRRLAKESRKRRRPVKQEHVKPANTEHQRAAGQLGDGSTSPATVARPTADQAAQASAKWDNEGYRKHLEKSGVEIITAGPDDPGALYRFSDPGDKK